MLLKVQGLRPGRTLSDSVGQVGVSKYRKVLIGPGFDTRSSFYQTPEFTTCTKGGGSLGIIF